jgi:hypothetical protein
MRSDIMGDYRELVWELGHNTKVLIELHRENPDEFDILKVIQLLEKEYDRLGLEPAED